MDNSQDKKDALSSVVNTTLRCANEETRDRDRDGAYGSVVEEPRMPRGCRLVKGIWTTAVAEHVPDHRPPAPGPKKACNFRECGIFLKPMKCRGADAKVKGRFVHRHLLKDRDHHVKRRVSVAFAKVRSQPRVWFDGD